MLIETLLINKQVVIKYSSNDLNKITMLKLLHSNCKIEEDNSNDYKYSLYIYIPGEICEL